MPVIANEYKRLSDLLKHEYMSKYCRKVVTVNGSEAGDMEVGTVLGTADDGATYIPTVETAADGSEVPAAIVIGTPDGEFGPDVTVEAGGTDVIALFRGPAIVGADALVLDASYDNATKVAALHAAIEENMGVVVGEQV